MDNYKTYNMTVRHIFEEELDDLVVLYTHLHPNDIPLPPQSDLKRLWHDIISNPLLHYFVVDFQGSIVSSCCLTIIPNLTRGARPYGLIENLVTHSDFRDKGFGKAVINFALEFAWKSDCYKVMLLSGVHRKEAHNLYESIGFNKDEKIGYVAKPTAHNQR